MVLSNETNPTDNESTRLIRRNQNVASGLWSGICITALDVLLVGLLFAAFGTRHIWNSVVSIQPTYHEFPEDFVFGAATSAYQIEGAAYEDGKGLSIWDTYCLREGAIEDKSSGDVACDHYHKMEEDVKLMKELGLKAYRFSIAWPRILPNGKLSGGINEKGIGFYNRLIDELLKNDIEPWVTLYHWDLPQALEDEYGGWLSEEVVQDFGNYAQTCFEAFGDRVKRWITINEAWTVAVQAYGDGTKAPAKTDNSAYDVYQVAHHTLLAHARAVKYYREYTSEGTIGMSNCGDFRYPLDPNSMEDREAAERSMVFQYAWFVDPLVYGEYPVEMRSRLGDRLPTFTPSQQIELMGSLDFMGLNHYSTLYASANKELPAWEGYWADMDVEFSSNPSWRKNFMGWTTNPDGCRELLRWIANRYKGIPIVITENGTAEDDSNLDVAKHDVGRRDYLEGYLRACAQAILSGVPLEGYFAWSLMDNFEWEYGYTKRFGICYVDYETMERTPKSSALWYKETIRARGTNIARV